jgi:hypothetical protein
MSPLLAGIGSVVGLRAEADGRPAEPACAHRGGGEGAQHHGAGRGHQVRGGGGDGVTNNLMEQSDEICVWRLFGVCAVYLFCFMYANPYSYM